MDFAGKRALVLGGTSGIGEGVVRALLDNGARVVCSSRIKRNAPEDAERQGRYHFVGADAVDPLGLAEMVDHAGDRLGGLDLVVHSIGGGCSGSVMEVPRDHWFNAFAVHVHSVLHLTQAVVPLMRKSAGGAILLVASAAAYRSPADAIGYSTVKAAQIQMARCLANDLAKDNIRVNCVSPGFIATPYHGKASQAHLKTIADDRIPLRRFGNVDEVAQLILAVAGNGYVTGQSVVIDGGLNLSWR